MSIKIRRLLLPFFATAEPPHSGDLPHILRFRGTFTHSAKGRVPPLVPHAFGMNPLHQPVSTVHIRIICPHTALLGYFRTLFQKNRFPVLENSTFPSSHRRNFYSSLHNPKPHPYRVRFFMAASACH